MEGPNGLEAFFCWQLRGIESASNGRSDFGCGKEIDFLPDKSLSDAMTLLQGWRLLDLPEADKHFCVGDRASLAAFCRYVDSDALFM